MNYQGLWEEDKYILLRTESDESFASKMQWTSQDLHTNVKRVNDILLEKRAERIRPGTDDKSITSWNSMTISGLVSAYEALGKEEYLTLAKNNMGWILQDQLKKDSSLFHTAKNGK